MKQYIYLITPITILFLLAGCASTNGLHFVKTKPLSVVEITYIARHSAQTDTIATHKTDVTHNLQPVISKAINTKIDNNRQNMHMALKQGIKIIAKVKSIAKALPVDPAISPNYPPGTDDAWYKQHQEQVALAFLIGSVICVPLAYFVAVFGLFSLGFMITALIISSNARRRLIRVDAPDYRISMANTVRILSTVWLILCIVLLVIYIVALLILLSILLSI